MSTRDDGGSVFPHDQVAVDQYDSDGKLAGVRVYHPSPGMSLHHWYKGMAMQGILSNPNIHPGEVGDTYVEQLSQFFADAMIPNCEPKEVAP